MKIGKVITLNDMEQRICKKIASERYSINRKNGIIDRKKGDQSNEFTDLEGFSGEFAFCKLFNIFPDFYVKVTDQKTDTGDCTFKGKSIDVKTTKYPNGRLICAMWKNENVDLYALMVGEFPTYKYCGFVKAKDLKVEENIINLGRGNVYALTQGELKDFYKKKLKR